MEVILWLPEKVQRPVSGKKNSKEKSSKTSASRQIKSEASGLLIFTIGILMALSIYFDNMVGPLGELFGKFVGGCWPDRICSSFDCNVPRPGENL